MGFAHCLVGKADLPVGQCQVVQGKPGQLAGRGVWRAFQFVEHVINVVAPAAQVGQRHAGRVNCNRIHHGSQAQQRFKFSIYIDALDAELGNRIGR